MILLEKRRSILDFKNISSVQRNHSYSFPLPSFTDLQFLPNPQLPTSSCTHHLPLLSLISPLTIASAVVVGCSQKWGGGRRAFTCFYWKLFFHVLVIIFLTPPPHTLTHTPLPALCRSLVIYLVRLNKITHILRLMGLGIKGGIPPPPPYSVRNQP